MSEREYLVFQLAGPLAAWGDIAIGEHRPTHRGPTRSATMGLLAGALRYRRSETQRLNDLSAGVGVATLTLAEGAISRDYHTSQVPPAVAVKGRRGLTRREELQALIGHNRQAGSSTGTILSTREYLCDAAWLVALWAREESPVPLQTLAAALRRPGFVPFLGRKSCPLTLPLGPQIVTAASVADALRGWWAARPKPSVELMLNRGAAARPHRLEWDLDGEAGVPLRSQTNRRDAPGDRIRWQFRNRSLCQGECVLEETT